MNLLPFADPNDAEDLIKLSNIMQNFDSLFSDQNFNKLTDTFDIQTVLQEGRVDDFIKCIRNVLQYNFDICSNSNVQVFDSTFVRVFRISQVIIQFLLYWKSELVKENNKLKAECQVLQTKQSKINLAKKLNGKDIEKQSSAFTVTENGINESFNLECTYCKKVFINTAFLTAHHKRRHLNMPFQNTKLSGDVKSVHHGNNALKSRPNFKTGDQVDMEIEEQKGDFIPLKMKLIPEVRCLEAQEKFWKGKMKELSEKCTQEKEEIKATLEATHLENKRLQAEFWETKSICKTCTSTQTDMYLEAATSEPTRVITTRNSRENIAGCKTTQIYNENFSYASKYRLSAENVNKFENFKEKFSKTETSGEQFFSDYVEKIAPGKNYIRDIAILSKSLTDVKHLKDHDASAISASDTKSLISDMPHEYGTADADYDYKNTITKLFTSNEADKFIKLYEKRHTIIPQIVHEENEASEKCTADTNESELSDTEVFLPQTLEHDEKTFLYNENNKMTDAELHAILSKKNFPQKNEKPKFLPNFRNIRTKMLKNLLKIKKTYKEGSDEKSIYGAGQTGLMDNQMGSLKHKIKDNINSIFIENEYSPGQSKVTSQDKNFNRPDNVKNSYPPEKKLTSALKKAKSTGNIVKKVAFADNLPTLKIASESNIHELALAEENKLEHSNSAKIGSIHVHYDKFARPVPAPRAKKNVIISNLVQVESMDEFLK